MPPRDSSLARRFAFHVSKKFISGEFRRILNTCPPQTEHKAVAASIKLFLEKFLNSEHLSLKAAFYDWEGNKARGSLQKNSYGVLGTWSHPDATVRGLFKCAFEFDREPKAGSSGFKDALMKASVHVLSGAYQSCVLVYILKPGSEARNYLDGKSHTKKLIANLRGAGLYVCLVPKLRLNKSRP